MTATGTKISSRSRPCSKKSSLMEDFFICLQFENSPLNSFASLAFFGEVGGKQVLDSQHVFQPKLARPRQSSPIYFLALSTAAAIWSIISRSVKAIQP